jgi:uncharacterized protein (DUF302 family)
MKTTGSYAFEITTRLSFEEAIARVTAALGTEGFGVLTEIDVRATFQKKLGLDTPPFRILGACNPPFAHRALSAEPLVGVLMPCNVTVREAGDHRVIAAMEPNVMSLVIDRPEIATIAGEVSERLHRVLAAVESE